MCVSAMLADENNPNAGIFVDYANLPDAIPEFVFPEHFGMAEEVSKVPGICDVLLCEMKRGVYVVCVCRYVCVFYFYLLYHYCFVFCCQHRPPGRAD